MRDLGTRLECRHTRHSIRQQNNLDLKSRLLWLSPWMEQQKSRWDVSWFRFRSISSAGIPFQWVPNLSNSAAFDFQPNCRVQSRFRANNQNKQGRYSLRSTGGLVWLVIKIVIGRKERVLGYVHTVPDRFSLRCKSCSGTVWTRINVLLRCRKCSEAFPVWTEALSVIQFAKPPFDLKRSFTKTRFRCNFYSDRSVQTWLGPFQKPIRYGTFHFQQRSEAVLFRSRNCLESSVPDVNRSPIRYTFCDAPFHYPVQCEHSLNAMEPHFGCNSDCFDYEMNAIELL